MKTPVFRIALIGATFLALAACGNKGPLVMPQKPVPVEAHPATPATETQPATQTTQPTDGTQSSTKDSDGQ